MQKEKERIAQLEAENAALRERVNQLEARLAEPEGDWRKIAITAASPIQRWPGEEGPQPAIRRRGC